MGTYYEPRVPQGAPTDGERDVWLENGKIKFGYYDATSGNWIVDSELSGGTASDVTIGDWHVVGDTGEPAFKTGFYGYPALQFRERNGYLEIAGEAYADVAEHCALVIFTLPEGFRPASDYPVNFKDWSAYNHWTVYANGDVKVTGTFITYPECFFPRWNSTIVPL